MVLSYPLMSVTKAIAARIGSATGRGIAQNLREHYSPWLLRAAVLVLLVANTVNIGADLGAMGDALKLLIGGPLLVYTDAFARGCVLLEVFVRYKRYAALLKWLALSLLAYVAVLFVVHIDPGEALAGTFVPSFSFKAGYAQAVVAVLGTTISPYLFFWQASQEVEEVRRRRLVPLNGAPASVKRELQRIKTDTWTGMGYSNLIALFIILATAATLHANGITHIDTSAEAAEALRPVAGEFAFELFAAGIIGTGLLAVPVLAGSAAYAVCESFGWVSGLDLKLGNATAFYGVIAVSTAIGLALNFIGVNPIKALYWTAILNGVLAAPLMALMLMIASNRDIMGDLAIPSSTRAGGWIATLVMGAASVAFLVS